MFSLGRADVFAPGDLAIQEAAKLLFDLPERPSECTLRKMSEHGRRGGRLQRDCSGPITRQQNKRMASL